MIRRGNIILAISVALICIAVLFAACDTGASEKLTATYDDSHTVYVGDDLDSIKPYLTVKYTDKQGTETTVQNYTLSGTLQEGQNVITVEYNGKTCTVEVTAEIDLLQYELAEGGESYIVTGIDDRTVSSIVIPSEYNGKPVTSIGNSAFSSCSKLTSVKIPDSITSIDSGAFRQCLNLAYITIPDSVTSIGSSAFSNCTNLTSVTMGNNVTNIGEKAFYYCIGLTTLTIPNGVTTIGTDAFSGCRKLLEVYNLSQLTITAGTQDNGSVAYYARDVYTSTSETSKLTKTDDGYIFYDDNGNISLVGYTGNETELILPDKFNEKSYSIYNSAFYNCSSLTSITIPDSIAEIGTSAFTACSNLTKVNYLGTMEDWCNISFGSASANPLYYAHNLYLNDKLVTELIIPETVTEIKDFTFSNCTSITSVTIPDSVTTIGSWVFSDCSNLKEIRYGGTVSDWNAITKGSGWNSNVSATKVICSDGEVTL